MGVTRAVPAFFFFFFSGKGRQNRTEQGISQSSVGIPQEFVGNRAGSAWIHMYSCIPPEMFVMIPVREVWQRTGRTHRDIP